MVRNDIQSDSCQPQIEYKILLKPYFVSNLIFIKETSIYEFLAKITLIIVF
jgi:hypothetical protein